MWWFFCKKIIIVASAAAQNTWGGLRQRSLSRTSTPQTQTQTHTHTPTPHTHYTQSYTTARAHILSYAVHVCSYVSYVNHIFEVCFRVIDLVFVHVCDSTTLTISTGNVEYISKKIFFPKLQKSEEILIDLIAKNLLWPDLQALYDIKMRYMCVVMCHM